jgi:di/tricarboxylate transporter
MPADQIFVCALALVTLALFVWERFPLDLVAIGVLLVLFVVPFDGHAILRPAGEAKQAEILGKIFANSGLLTVAFMFVLGAAIERTGMIEVLGQWFMRVAGTGPRRILLILGCLAIPASGFLNNTTVVVVFLPLVISICRKLQLPPSRFLIPLSYFAIAGGMCTMIGTSTNIIVNGKLKDAGLPEFRMFDITGIGLLLAVIIMAFMLTLGRKLLPDRVSLAALLDEEDGREFLTAAIVSGDSPLLGKLITETPLAKNRAMRVIEVRRSGNRVDQPLNEIRFEAGDRIIMKSHVSGVVDLDAVKGIEMAAKSEFGLAYAKTEKAVLMEGMVGPHSRFVGRTLRQLNFRHQFGVLILAVHRHGENLRENFENVRLEFGDTLLLEGSPERMRELFQERNLVNISSPKQSTVRRGRAWLAGLALVFIVVMGAVDIMPFQWVALTAALGVTLGGCLKPEEAYEAVDWRILCMLMGTLALSVAMDVTNADEWIVHNLLGFARGWDLRIMVSLVLLVSIVLNELLSNNAVAALLTPLAITLAADLGADYHPFVMAVMLGSSIGFAVPAGYQTHMLVYGAGGYRFSDFFRAGLPLDIVLWIAGSLLIPVFWPV